MIEKIISGDQTGVEQGALDAAIKLSIPHGGLISMRRKTKNRACSNKYQLTEISNTSYTHSIKQRVVDSDGTLIIFFEKITSRSLCALRFAKRYDRTWLLIDLNNSSTFNAALTAIDWIIDYDIKVLNVTGSTRYNHHEVYQRTMEIIENIYYLSFSYINIPNSLTGNFSCYILPKTVQESVDFLIDRLSLKDKVKIAKLAVEELDPLFLILGEYIKRNFRLCDENFFLIESCQQLSNEKDLCPDHATQIIIEALWERLRTTYALRIVK